MRERWRLELRGAVQGVGFRPFVHRLAGELSLDGWVANDSHGVVIEVEGPREPLERFVERLAAEKPEPARIDSLRQERLEPTGAAGFRIHPSQDSSAKTTEVLPDIASCSHCLDEVFDPADRRHGYPFTNCSHCGPRFSIVRSLPYDRSGTTMRGFAMCAACRAEYEEPRHRRFHAQPNACPVCGPQLALWESDGRVRASGPAALDAAVEALQGGAILALKGLGGFHLMVDAGNGAAIARLRDKKPRREKPLALMVRDLDQARALCRLDREAESALRSAEAPILLLPRRSSAPVHESVAPGNPHLGIMLPYTPLHHLLLRRLELPVVATSGNRSEEPICTDEAEAVERLGDIADLLLVHDRPIARHVDDSVAWSFRGQTRLLRRARGYAPRPVVLASEMPTILAVGAHLKNAVALSVGRQVFVSQHIGDMDTPQALEAFQRVIADFLRLYDAQPVVVAHDLHPDYLSTRWAQQATAGTRSERPGTQGASERLAAARLLAVQHHHAHLACCLAENGFDAPALGVTWDGTGYGLDGSVWGGEFLLGTAASFRRVAHLRPFRLPGGEAAVREPRRAAIALLWELYGASALEREDLEPVRSFRASERRLLAKMLERGIHAPRATSAGRLFDAVAALLGLWQRTCFEAQAAMGLEFLADPDVREAYPLELVDACAAPSGEPPAPAAGAPGGGQEPAALMLDWRSLLEAILRDRGRGVPAGVIAARFHNALVEGIVRVAREIGPAAVALSGGCFQNRRLLEGSVARLEEAGFEVLLHRQLPPNDGGIGLGQVAVAAARWGRAQVGEWLE